jgi:eukaryotic-like serine/threonine-protein kinase
VETAVSDPLVGSLLDGRYRVEARIARGGMATVYTALDTRLDRIVALKIMIPTFADDADFVARFHREAKAAARLSHPNVVSVYDQGSDGAHVFLVMEYVEGRTLRDLLRERGRLTPAQALSIIDPVLAALKAAHGAGLVHRDIKPENVLLADDGRVKVADFGLARGLGGDNTATGQVLIGTVAYLSPEQVDRNHSDARSDVYAAGVLLYEMLVGRPPFEGDTAMAVAMKHVSEDVPAPSTAEADVPDVLDELVRTATNRDPERRFVDAGAMLAAVTASRTSVGGVDHPAVSAPSAATTPPSTKTAVLGAPLSPPPPPPATTAPEEPARRRWRPGRGLIAGAVIAILALVAALLGYYFAAYRYTTVPSVLTKKLTTAESILRSKGLHYKVGPEVFDPTIPTGYVAKESPGPNHRIGKHGTVTIQLSKGPELYDVPNLHGKTVDDATSLLHNQHLEVGTTSEAYSDSVDQGKIVSTQPKHGEALPPGSKVDLVVSQGPAPVTIPDETGKPIDEAKSTLKGLGLVVHVRHVYSDQYPAGDVAEQTPVGSGHRGDTVTVSESKGPQLIAVPDVHGESAGQAKSDLEHAGFKVKVDEPFGPGGVVRGQNPGAGSAEPRGTTVTIIVF